MKLNNLFPNLTRNLISGAAMMTIVASTSILTGCTKEDNITPEKTVKKPSSAFGAGQGTDRGYFWTLWSGGGGTSDISFPNSATYPGQFRITYTNDACVGGKGWATGTDTRVINYNVGYLTGPSTYNTVGVYGWVQTPLIEYYVNEAGFTPWDFGQRAKLGDVWVDGRKYVFSRHLQEGKASIEGDNKTFWQYIDNISTAVVFNGNKKVSMKGHVDNWKRYGGKGWGSKHNYQVFAIEAFGGKTGQIDASIW
jgi:endo-1,4-beta-xylanase